VTRDSLTVWQSAVQEAGGRRQEAGRPRGAPTGEGFSSQAGMHTWSRVLQGAAGGSVTRKRPTSNCSSGTGVPFNVAGRRAKVSGS
jgi:hypothetical protein